MSRRSTTHGIPRRSMAIAAFSTVVEWYDFTLYLYLATVLSRVFYGGGTASLALTLGGFAVAYLMRPLGAIVFGRIGDRHGRRAMMLASMALMTVAMLGIALLPTRETIGPAAGWLLLALRCVMAFSVGGEYTGVVAYLFEGAAPDRRGLVTSSASAASEVGGLLAVGVSAATVSLMSAEALAAWGWRIPFFLGAGLAGAVALARSTLQESPEFEQQRAAGTIPDAPLRQVLTHHRPAILRGFAISALGSITYYVGIVYVPAFLTSVGAMGEGAALWLSTAAAVMVIAVTPFVGVLSDRIGRKPVLLGICAAAALLPATMFAVMASGGPVLALGGALVLAALGGAMSAVGAVATAEQFPGEGRLSGLALGATAATALFGGLAPLVSQLLLERTGWPMVPGIMIAVVALAVAPVLIGLRETRPVLPAR
ncbi:MFS transporter [Sphingomonas sp. Leaf407]|uniref:MFS transporter n=1 Tax=unclassified Sphingomonas TaxID=196159 RepID=UPI0006FA2C40|nr:MULTISPECIES: MFS transporter [unclassified Sphingomonas]KQN37414.1 MFS transporter [Sphingomonas sp. Leaf42]KQT27783.1 MFS transporter [Sphingomonas sp. Leaf407]